MSSEQAELAAWRQRQREEALRQIELFGSGAVKAILQMSNGTTEDITSGVLTHQKENAAVFERLAAALAA